MDANPCQPARWRPVTLLVFRQADAVHTGAVLGGMAAACWVLACAVSPGDVLTSPPASARATGADTAPTASAPASSSSDVAAAAPEPEPRCTRDGCVRAAVHVGDFRPSDLAPTLSPGVKLENGYALDTLRFWTSGAEALATVATPLDRVAPLGGYHVVVNAHGTAGLDDPCVVAGTVAGAGLAGTFGGRGLVGVAVDYPGLGTPGIHPYLVAEVEGRAVLDALRASQAFERWRGVPLSGRSAAVGVSQGGHATLAAAAAHHGYARELDIRAFGVVAPASGFEEHWRRGIAYDGMLVAVHAMLVYAWADHHGYRGPPLWAPGVETRIDDIMRRACTFSSLGAPSLAAELGSSPAAIFAPGFLAAYQSGNWGPFSAFAAWFADNRVKPYHQTAPLRVYQGDADTVIPEWATRQLVDALRAGGVELTYEVVHGGTHTDVAFGFVAYPERRTDEALAWLRRELDAAPSATH